MNKKSKFYENMGLCFSHKKLYYTPNGFIKWMPTFIKRSIVKIWNKISCLVIGHYWFSLKKDRYETCCDCMKRKLK